LDDRRNYFLFKVLIDLLFLSLLFNWFYQGLTSILRLSRKRLRSLLFLNYGFRLGTFSLSYFVIISWNRFRGSNITLLDFRRLNVSVIILSRPDIVQPLPLNRSWFLHFTLRSTDLNLYLNTFLLYLTTNNLFPILLLLHKLQFSLFFLSPRQFPHWTRITMTLRSTRNISSIPRNLTFKPIPIYGRLLYSPRKYFLTWPCSW
jgi:hypothetical protein